MESPDPLVKGMIFAAQTFYVIDVVKKGLKDIGFREYRRQQLKGLESFKPFRIAQYHDPCSLSRGLPDGKAEYGIYCRRVSPKDKDGLRIFQTLDHICGHALSHEFFEILLRCGEPGP